MFDSDSFAFLGSVDVVTMHRQFLGPIKDADVARFRSIIRSRARFAKRPICPRKYWAVSLGAGVAVGGGDVGAGLSVWGAGVRVGVASDRVSFLGEGDIDGVIPGFGPQPPSQAFAPFAGNGAAICEFK